MIRDKTETLFRRFDDAELRLCLFFNRGCQRALLRHLFAVVSRLGNGVFWYSLMAALPFVYGPTALYVSLRMAGVAIAGLVIYKLLKRRLLRERPFIQHKNIRLGTAPLDQYSFPSGHTLHAVAFTAVVLPYYPELAWLLVPFATLVAASRMVLGLHYPTDVLAGAVLGLSLAQASFLI